MAEEHLGNSMGSSFEITDISILKLLPKSTSGGGPQFDV